MGLEPDLTLNDEELEENKLTIKKVMDINKCVAAFLAEQEPNEKQARKSEHKIFRARVRINGENHIFFTKKK